ncbi:dihydrofolate reductase [Ktedonosporobacter rubrisoli]|uniref:Dihydrofolate reductase n=1 Tax=Ktedonosporobacter rubrisoli TaxID=2509675 RepID=A0A4P6JVI4_KTERU|nr:dihydrofolate reductase family protein [Ktedonosporobacter rubrisoli]QBD79445.1 dihydrofolate reductase [Ktedonosporobacter rubrisoli]
MRKIVVAPFVTLDGVMQAPGEPDEIKHGGWLIPFINDELLKHQLVEYLTADGLLLGRLTYHMFSTSWPTMTDEGLIEGMSARMNEMPKYVVSKTLTETPWNNSRLLEGDLAQAIARLKQGGDRNIIVGGSCDLVHSLIQQDLVDEYQFIVAPVIVGNGKHVFRDGTEKMKTLKLTGTKIFSNGVMVLTYQPLRNA